MSILNNQNSKKFEKLEFRICDLFAICDLNIIIL